MSGDFDNHALKQLPRVCDWRARTHWIWPQSPDSRLRVFFFHWGRSQKVEVQYFCGYYEHSLGSSCRCTFILCFRALTYKWLLSKQWGKEEAGTGAGSTNDRLYGKRHEPHKTQLSVTRCQLSSLYLFFCAEVTPEHQSSCQLSGLWSRHYRILTASGRFVVSCCDESMSFSLRRFPLKRGSIIYCSARIP